MKKECEEAMDLKKRRIGFIGLGAMGAGMAQVLIETGYGLTVHDASRETLQCWQDKGVAVADSPRQLAEMRIVRS